MSKSGQENRGYTPGNDGLSNGRNTFKTSARHWHPPSPASFVRPASVADGHRLATNPATDGPIGRQTRLPSHDFAVVNCLGMSAPVPEYISSGVWP